MGGDGAEGVGGGEGVAGRFLAFLVGGVGVVDGAAGDAVFDDGDFLAGDALPVEGGGELAGVGGVVPDGDVFSGDLLPYPPGHEAAAFLDGHGAHAHVGEHEEHVADGGRLQDDGVLAGVDGLCAAPVGAFAGGGPGDSLDVELGDVGAAPLGIAAGVVVGDDGDEAGLGDGGVGANAEGVGDGDLGGFGGEGAGCLAPVLLRDGGDGAGGLGALLGSGGGGRFGVAGHGREGTRLRQGDELVVLGGETGEVEGAPGDALHLILLKLVAAGAADALAEHGAH